MSNRLGGKQGTAYLGTNANQPPNMHFNDRDPNQYDINNVALGDEWLNTANKVTWKLVSLAGNSSSRGALAEWVMISGGSGTLISLVSDSGTAVPTAGEITIAGGSNINTSATGSTLTVNLDSSVSIGGSFIAGTTIASGTTITAGTNLVSTADTIVGDDLTVADDVTFTTITNGVLQTNGSGVVTATNGTNGQVLIGGGAAPTWANLTSSGGTITITNGANSINLEAVGGGGGSGSGSLVFIAEQTASGDTSLDFTGGINSTFNDYYIILDEINPTVANNSFVLQLSVNGGSTWITTGYVNSSTTTTVGLELVGISGITVPSITSFSSAVAVIHNVTSGVDYVQSTGGLNAGIWDPMTGLVGNSGGNGSYATPNIVANAFRFLYDDGSAFDGTVKIYGLATTPVPVFGGGSLVFIEKQTANSDTSLDFLNGISNVYDNYFVLLNQLQPTVANKEFLVQLSTNGGFSWITSNYFSGVGQPTTGIELVSPIASVTSFTSAQSFLMNITSGIGYANANSVQFQILDPIAVSNTFGQWAGFYRTANISANALRFKYSDGSPFDGDIELYAYSNTAVSPSATTGLVFISEQTTASATSLDFTTGITSTYKDYLMIIKNLKPTVAGKNFLVQLSINGGGAWITTNYNNVTGGGTSGINIAAQNSGTTPTTDSYTDGSAILMNVTTGVGIVGMATSSVAIFDPTAMTTQGANASGFYLTPTTLVDALRFKYDDGSAFAGTVKLYGYVD
jgi:hypothetical protein